jgi:glutathione S-transferase
MNTPSRLITIPPSHYCEKARWALNLAKVPFIEERHPPLFHVRAARKGRATGHSTPVLVADGEVMPDSTEILEFVQRRHGAAWGPYPLDSQLRFEVDELEELFDTRLGPHTRRLAYFHLLQRRDLFLGSVLAGVSGWERRIFTALAPVMASLMRRGMNINAASAERSLGRVREVFSGVADRLADGRKYLVGGEFSAADLTFAALAAPTVLPRNYGSPLPTLDQLPGGMLTVVEEFRVTPAGEFVLKVYRDHR